ncbi:unnamed protein product, partial [Discosporangium mesarthrocarpum]
MAWGLWNWRKNRIVDVTYAHGTVRGSLTEDPRNHGTVATFKGIPYAEPPVGPLRWRPPRPVKPWSGVRWARRYASDAPQLGVDFLAFLRNVVVKHGFNFLKTKVYINGVRLFRGSVTPRQSEDCLYLNVRTSNPAVVGKSTGRRVRRRSRWRRRPTEEQSDEEQLTQQGLYPVMVHIHGGDYHDGSGGGRPFHNSNAIPLNGRVVLVTFNYRLGLFGSFTHPELSAEAKSEGRPEISGNYGLLDQIAVLHWVQDNICAFGGDPNNVTIMGGSAGGESVTYMMTSPLSRGLFHRAIAQSPASTPNTLMHLRHPFACFVPSEENGVNFADRLVRPGPGQVSRLRKLPMSELQRCYYDDGTRRPVPRQLFFPVVDGHIVPKPPIDAFAAGEQAPVPMLIGSNKDEGSLCYPVTYHRTDLRDALYPTPVRDAGRQAYGEEVASKLASMYDPSWYSRGEVGEQGTAADMDYMTDRVFGQKVHWLARYHCQELGQPTYLYVFTASPPGEAQTVGAFHGAEVPFVFGARPWFAGAAEDARLASAMSAYWCSFAWAGDPNKTRRPQVHWPEENDSEGRHIVLGHSIEVRPVERTNIYKLMHIEVSRTLAELRRIR